MCRKLGTFAATLFIAGLISAPAWSQTREETVEFLFRGSRIETPLIKIYVAKDAIIKEDSCVIEINGKLDGSRFPPFSKGKAPNPLTALGGHDYKIHIGFDKLITKYLSIDAGKYGLNVKIIGEGGAIEAVLPEVVNKKEIDDMGATYRGSPAPQVRDGAVESSSALAISYLDDDVGEEKIARIPNAFKYFISAFCAGKPSAF